MDDPYEEPEQAEIVIRTDQEDVTRSAERVIDYLLEHNHIPDKPSAKEREEDSRFIERKMREMGYLE